MHDVGPEEYDMQRSWREDDDSRSTALFKLSDGSVYFHFTEHTCPSLLVMEHGRSWVLED